LIMSRVMQCSAENVAAAAPESPYALSRNR
jgi:hypothetical protein